MSLKNKFLTGIAMATAVGAFAVAASAQTTTTTPQTDGLKQERGWGGHRKGGEGRRGPRGGDAAFMFHDLNLTDAQKSQIKSILDANKPSDAEMQQIKSLQEARRSGTQLTDEQKAQFQAIHQQILAILTPEQKQQLEQKQQERRQQMEQRRQQRQQGDKPSTDGKSDDN
jgi:periplasmic protein CpxP/Spy